MIRDAEEIVKGRWPHCVLRYDTQLCQVQAGVGKIDFRLELPVFAEPFKMNDQDWGPPLDGHDFGGRGVFFAFLAVIRVVP